MITIKPVQFTVVNTNYKQLRASKYGSYMRFIFIINQFKAVAILLLYINLLHHFISIAQQKLQPSCTCIGYRLTVLRRITETLYTGNSHNSAVITLADDLRSCQLPVEFIFITRTATLHAVHHAPNVLDDCMTLSDAVTGAVSSSSSSSSWTSSLSRTRRRICSPDIRSVSALEVVTLSRSINRHLLTYLLLCRYIEADDD